MCLTGAFHLLYLPNNLVVRGDAGATPAKLVSSELLVRSSIVSGLVSGVSAIVFALLLNGSEQHRAIAQPPPLDVPTLATCDI